MKNNNEVEWGLYDEKNKWLNPKPLNSKNQLQITNEIIEAFDAGHKFVLLDGACGTGKTAIALHVIHHYKGKGVIVVPTNDLQKQYKDDTKRVYDLKIGHILGRKNLQDCLFNKENNNRSKRDPDYSVCILEKPKGISRYSIASKCCHWSMRCAANKYLENKFLYRPGYTNYTYPTYNGYWNLFFSDKSCDYSRQQLNYINSDVIVLSSMLWEIDTLRGAKPKCCVEVIDEYDLFFDGLMDEITISDIEFNNLYPTKKEIQKLDEAHIVYDEQFKYLLDKKNVCVNEFNRLYKCNQQIKNDEVISFLNDLYRPLLMDTIEYLDNENYELESKLSKLDFLLNNVDLLYFETAIRFRKSKYKTYQIHQIKVCCVYPLNIINHLFSDNLSSKRILLMSGTPHKKEVFEKIFGIQPHVVYADTRVSGINTLMDISADKRIELKNGGWMKQDRQQAYIKMMCEIVDYIVRLNEKVLIQSAALSKYGAELRYIERYKDIMCYTGSESDGTSTNETNKWLDNPKKLILISTTAKRGVSFEKNKCRHIIIDKCPYPRLSTKINALKKRFKNKADYNSVYLDMTDRDLLQQITRASRGPDDSVTIWTVDKDAFHRIELLKSKFEDKSFKIEKFNLIEEMV